jgi:hypothetical protein
MAIDWSDIERRLSSPFGSVNLRAGTNELVLRVEPISKNGLRYGVVVYVDGYMRGKFLREEDEIGRRFYPLVTRRLVSKSKAKAELPKLTRAFGKKEARRLSGIDRTYSFRHPYWTCPKRLCAHLRKNEPDLELLEGL